MSWPDLLTVPDLWVTFTERYLQVLDDLALPAPAPAPTRRREMSYDEQQRRLALERQRARRAETMIDWHLMLLDRFADTPEEDLLDRLADHPALGGAEQTYFRARLTWIRGEPPRARLLIRQALEQLPGHSRFLAFAEETGTELPPRARAIAESRRSPSS